MNSRSACATPAPRTKPAVTRHSRERCAAAHAVVTVGIVSGDSPTKRPPPPPARVAEWRWLATSVLTACAAWAVLAVMSGPQPLARTPRLIFVFLLCSMLIMLRRWPLPVLGVAALISGLAVA